MVNIIEIYMCNRYLCYCFTIYLLLLRVSSSIFYPCIAVSAAMVSAQPLSLQTKVTKMTLQEIEQTFARDTSLFVNRQLDRISFTVRIHSSLQSIDLLPDEPAKSLLKGILHATLSFRFIEVRLQHFSWFDPIIP